jgi:hypothetical protein
MTKSGPPPLNYPYVTMIPTKRKPKLIHEGDYVAEVEVELSYETEGWNLYLSVEDARKLDEVRAALKKGDLKTATRLAKVYALSPVEG